jgi:ABC-type transporter Mla subunit MlaD
MPLQQTTLRSPEVVQTAKQFGANPLLASQICLRYSQLSPDIETAFAKLVDVARSAVDELADKIKTLDAQIKALKATAEKINRIQAAMKRLLPALLDAVGSDTGRPCPPSRLNVSLRLSRLNQAIREVEDAMATVAQDDAGELRELVKQLRRMAEQAPALFNIPGLR